MLSPQGRILYADYRTRRKIPRLEQLALASGLAGELRDITKNVVSACELDAERRRGVIRSGVPWFYRLLLSGHFERYAALPGTFTFERFSTFSKFKIKRTKTKTKKKSKMKNFFSFVSILVRSRSSSVYDYDQFVRHGFNTRRTSKTLSNLRSFISRWFTRITSNR